MSMKLSPVLFDRVGGLDPWLVGRQSGSNHCRKIWPEMDVRKVIRAFLMKMKYWFEYFQQLTVLLVASIAGNFKLKH